MTEAPRRVVFDCNVFAQALISPKGPARACLVAAQNGRFTLFVSDYVLQEIRELPEKLPPRFGVTAATIDDFIQNLAKHARPVDKVPEAYVHPVDPDDSHYVNLAVATGSQLIVSRDGHLLGLMNPATAEGRDFQRLFPTLSVVTPDVLAGELRRAGEEKRPAPEPEIPRQPEAEIGDFEPEP